MANKYYNRNAVELWRGKSRIDGADIVVLATGLVDKSDNKKTGDMVQIFILRADVDPVTAHEKDLDVSICGHCPFRRNSEGKRSCYVNIGQAPLSAWRSWKRGNVRTFAEYPKALEKLTSKPVRVGAYGDPAAFPADVVKDILARAPKHTGYTHQWREAFAQDWRGLLQASVETPLDAAKAMNEGWNYYRVLLENEQPTMLEHACLSNKGKTCAECGLCNGRYANMFIVVHGAGKVNYKKVRA